MDNCLSFVNLSVVAPLTRAADRTENAHCQAIIHHTQGFPDTYRSNISYNATRREEDNSNVLRPGSMILDEIASESPVEI